MFALSVAVLEPGARASTLPLLAGSRLRIVVVALDGLCRLRVQQGEDGPTRPLADGAVLRGRDAVLGALRRLPLAFPFVFVGAPAVDLFGGGRRTTAAS